MWLLFSFVLRALLRGACRNMSARMVVFFSFLVVGTWSVDGEKTPCRHRRRPISRVGTLPSRACFCAIGLGSCVFVGSDLHRTGDFRCALGIPGSSLKYQSAKPSARCRFVFYFANSFYFVGGTVESWGKQLEKLDQRAERNREKVQAHRYSTSKF